MSFILLRKIRLCSVVGKFALLNVSVMLKRKFLWQAEVQWNIVNIWEIRLPYLAVRQNKVIIWNVISCDLLCWKAYWVASILCNIWVNFPKLSATAHWSGEKIDNWHRALLLSRAKNSLFRLSNWKNLEMLISKPEQLETQGGF